jgi:hypothetical protein
MAREEEEEEDNVSASAHDEEAKYNAFYFARDVDNSVKCLLDSTPSMEQVI